MASNKARREQIKAKRAAQRRKDALARVRAVPDSALVNAAALAPYNSYGVPQFVQRGYYVDIALACKDCGKTETWTASQQKWWYEVAQGNVETTAIRCRACRKKERLRKNEARIKSGHLKA